MHLIYIITQLFGIRKPNHISLAGQKLPMDFFYFLLYRKKTLYNCYRNRRYL